MTNTTALDLDRQRAEFEALDKGDHSRDGSGNYRHPVVATRFEGFQLARRSLPVDASGIKTWQERYATGELRPKECFMQDEIADLRAALAAKGQQEPVAVEALTGIQAAALFIEKRAEDYLRDHASTDDETGGVLWHFGDAGREYHDTLIELAEDLRRFSDQQVGACVRIDAYAPGSWFDASTVDEMQAFYLSRLPAIREAAKEHGYAIGLHGSARRDFDLMAMQWRDRASDKDTLARAIADAACGIRREGSYDWEQKPEGRVATSILVCWTACDNPDFDKPSVGHIDLSLIDLAAPTSGRESAAPAAPVREGDREQDANLATARDAVRRVMADLSVLHEDKPEEMAAIIALTATLVSDDLELAASSIDAAMKKGAQ